MAIQGATIVGPLIQHNVPIATVLFKNTGHPDWEMPLKAAPDAETVGEMGPGSVLSQTIPLIAPLTDVQGMYLERKDWFIVILGVVSYIDIFDGPHETHLCLIWRDTSTQYLSRCEKWNEAD